MMYCIFQNNQNNLFCVYEGSLEVSHSFIDHSGSFSISIAISTSNNNSFTNRITYQLQFFNSLHCNADIPLEQKSLEETLRMTYERTIDKTIRDTSINTLEETPLITLNESPMNISLSANSLRIVFVSVSIIVLIVGIIYVLGLIYNSEQDRSNLSNSKSDENVSSKI